MSYGGATTSEFSVGVDPSRCRLRQHSVGFRVRHPRNALMSAGAAGTRLSRVLNLLFGAAAEAPIPVSSPKPWTDPLVRQAAAALLDLHLTSLFKRCDSMTVPSHDLLSVHRFTEGWLLHMRVHMFTDTAPFCIPAHTLRLHSGDRLSVF